MKVVSEFDQALFRHLKDNPGISDGDLAEVLEGNLKLTFGNFHGSVQVSSKERSKIIYISPYHYFQDILISIQRAVMGVLFPPIKSADILQKGLLQGRRITIEILNDGSHLIRAKESNKRACWLVHFLKGLFFKPNTSVLAGKLDPATRVGALKILSLPKKGDISSLLKEKYDEKVLHCQGKIEGFTRSGFTGPGIQRLERNLQVVYRAYKTLQAH